MKTQKKMNLRKYLPSPQARVGKFIKGDMNHNDYAKFITLIELFTLQEDYKLKN